MLSESSGSFPVPDSKGCVKGLKSSPVEGNFEVDISWWSVWFEVDGPATEVPGASRSIRVSISSLGGVGVAVTVVGSKQPAGAMDAMSRDRIQIYAKYATALILSPPAILLIIPHPHAYGI